MKNEIENQVAALACFKDPQEITPLAGGLTNVNVLVTDGDNKYVVRLGADIPEHGVMRWNELALSTAASRAGLSPNVIHHEPGVLVLDFIDNRLEAATGKIDLVIGHNDLLAANILDDGKQLWLIDWEYGGFNSPLFDLAGLASNNGLSQQQEFAMLTQYFGTEDSSRWRSYNALKCSSLMRETLWSMTSEIHSKLDEDYASYSIVGCSTAYHLAQMGQEVLLLEKAQLTSGSTWHAAGLVGQLRSNANITQLLGYSIELYKAGGTGLMATDGYWRCRGCGLPAN